MNTPRIGTAVFLAPLSIWVPFIVTALFAGHGLVLLALGFVAVMFAYAGMLLIGLPALLVLRRFGLTKWWQVTIAGALGPAVLTWTDSTNAFLTFSLCGGFVALVAWFIGFYRVQHDDAKSDAATSSLA